MLFTSNVIFQQGGRIRNLQQTDVATETEKIGMRSRSNGRIGYGSRMIYLKFFERYSKAIYSS